MCKCSRPEHLLNARKEAGCLASSHHREHFICHLVSSVKARRLFFKDGADRQQKMFGQKKAKLLNFEWDKKWLEAVTASSSEHSKQADSSQKDIDGNRGGKGPV